MATVIDAETSLLTEWESSPDDVRIIASLRRGDRIRIAILWHPIINFHVRVGYEIEDEFQPNGAQLPYAEGNSGEESAQNW